MITVLLATIVRNKKWISIFALVALCYISFKTVSAPTAISDGQKWRGKQVIEQTQDQVKQISIPGIDKMTFTANDTEQRVNIYNPETNDCTIVFSLYIDEELLWRSGKCVPGYGFYDITLAHGLEAGNYQGVLLYECERDGKQLNSAKVNVEITVKGEK